MTNKTTKPDKPWLKRRARLYYTLAILSLLCFLLYLAWHFWEVIGWNIDLVKSLPDKCASLGIADTASCTEITRNFGWGIWMLLSVTGVGFGLWLAWQGRQIQKKQWKTQEKQWETQDKQWNTQHTSHLQERFEKATEMLGNEVELVRIGGCRSLMNLGINEESMKGACVGLLSDFIKNPYLEGKEKTEYLNLKSYEKGEYLTDLFPAREPLRPDIQSAVSSFLTIYQHYGATTMRNEPAKLPKYFWVNWEKNHVFLAKANLEGISLKRAILQHANLEGAYLWRSNLEQAFLLGANLEGADLKNANLKEAVFLGAKLNRTNLERAELERANLNMAMLNKANLRGTNLKEANFQDADLREADISSADMREVGGLTKEQVLSAKWGYEIFERDTPPQLPEDLMQDADIKKWLETPAYDNREFEYSQ